MEEIEKIKRKKKINDQDKQQPGTIQDLIRKYDLDNVKEDDYLDYLADYLNKDLSAKENSINTLNGQMTDKEQRVSTLESQMTDKEQRVSTLESDMTDKEQRVSGLENRWNTSGVSNVNYNDYKDSGTYYLGSNCTNAPFNFDWCRLFVMGKSDSGDITQIATQISTERIFIRTSSSGTWKDWKEIPRFVVGNGTFNTVGWYRVCRIDTTGHPGISALLNISTNYSYTEPCSVLISVLTTWKHGKITQLNAVYCGTHKPITKIRLVYDNNVGCFYIDAYYTMTNWNAIYVRNENILSDKVNILTPTLVTGSVTALQELTITY